MKNQKEERKLKAEEIRQNRNKMKMNLKNSMFLSNNKEFYNEKLCKSGRLELIKDRSKTYHWINNEIFEKNQGRQESLKFQDFYEIKEKLGEGMHAVVYRCIQKQTKNSYAVKIIQCKSEEFYIMIQKTFKLLKSLSHSGVIFVKDLFIQENNQAAYMVTQIVQYPTLRKFLDSLSKKRIQQKEIYVIILNLLKTLNYLHSKQICHRDIKPENIHYNPKSNELKLIDFDLACQKKITQEKLEMWTDTGSLFYRAPQSFQSGYDEKIDLWAVGIIAYELLTGTTPFQQKLLHDTKQTIKNRQLNAQQSLFETASLSFKSFVLKLLNKDPKQRLSVQQALQEEFMNDYYFSQKAIKYKSACQKLEKQTDSMDYSNTSANLGSFQDFQKLSKDIPRLKSKTFQRQSNSSSLQKDSNQKNQDKQKRKSFS